MDDFDQEPVNSGFIDTVTNAGWGALRLSLLFGTAVAALVIMLSPALQSTVSQRQSASSSAADPVVTGSVQQGQRAYRVRKSILQDDVTEPCIIYANGTESGNC